MRRTQIYLTVAEAEALGRESKRTGRTRSQLIREAVGARYLSANALHELERALTETAGAWRRPDAEPRGEATVERLRSGRRLGDVLSSRKRK